MGSRGPGAAAQPGWPAARRPALRPPRRSLSRPHRRHSRTSSASRQYEREMKSIWHTTRRTTHAGAHSWAGRKPAQRPAPASVSPATFLPCKPAKATASPLSTPLALQLRLYPPIPSPLTSKSCARMTRHSLSYSDSSGRSFCRARGRRCGVTSTSCCDQGLVREQKRQVLLKGEGAMGRGIKCGLYGEEAEEGEEPVGRVRVPWVFRLTGTGGAAGLDTALVP
jgi:hypothetical protein